MFENGQVTGVVLAGGLARRMEQRDKGLLLYNNRPLISYPIAALEKTANRILINANRNMSAYRRFGYPVIQDTMKNFAGPLAGISAAMQAAGTEVLLVLPCDSPLFQTVHLSRLLSQQRQQTADVAVASDGQRLHPVFLAIKTALQPDLEDYLGQGRRKIHSWLAELNTTVVDFSEEPDIFTNINTLQDLKQLQDNHFE